MDELVMRWNRRFPRLHGLGAELLIRWQEPHRCSHDPRHLAERLQALDRLAGGDVEELALWFHDAVYQGRRGSDERSSARLARQLLGEEGERAGVVDEVARLVRVTEHHRPWPSDSAAQRVSDADLAIFGARAERYRESVADLRRENAGVPDDQWRLIRLWHLRGLQRRGVIYATPRARALWQARAEANIAAELRAITRG